MSQQYGAVIEPIGIAGTATRLQAHCEWSVARELRNTEWTRISGAPDETSGFSVINSYSSMLDILAFQS